jgi:hypothetical protein
MYLKLRLLKSELVSFSFNHGFHNRKIVVIRGYFFRKKTIQFSSFLYILYSILFPLYSFLYTLSSILFPLYSFLYTLLKHQLCKQTLNRVFQILTKSGMRSRSLNCRTSDSR